MQNEVVTRPNPSEMSSKDLSLQKALLAAKAAIEKKGENVKMLQLTAVSSISDYFVICSGTSDRQVQAISDAVKTAVEGSHSDCKLLSREGYGDGRWVLLDFGDLIVHVFLDALRDYYDLEKIWGNAERVKIPSEFYGPAGTVQRLN